MIPNEPAAPSVVRPLDVTLALPPDVRANSALLWVEGPTIDSIRAPGLDLHASSAAVSGGGLIVVWGPLSTGKVLEIWAPAESDATEYRVEVREVAGADYQLLDHVGYLVQVTGRLHRSADRSSSHGRDRRPREGGF